MPSKKIIVLERDTTVPLAYKYALWATVPSGRYSKYADSGKTSSYKDISSQDLNELRSGMFLERVQLGSWDQGTAISAIQAELIGTYNLFQNEVTNDNTYQRYGTFWNGSSWTASGVN
jgi:hypothetical protein